MEEQADEGANDGANESIDEEEWSNEDERLEEYQIYVENFFKL